MVVAKSEAVATAATTSTTTTSPSRLELAHTTELYTGDIVRLIGFDQKAQNKDMKVVKSTSPCACESGVMVTIANMDGKVTYTVDRHWLELRVKASEIDFNDDIPF